MSAADRPRRWSFWTLLIWSGVQWLLIIFLVPETYHPVLLKKKAHKLRAKTGEDGWHSPIEKLNRSIPMVNLRLRHDCEMGGKLTQVQTIAASLTRPFILLTLEPMCLSLCVYSALVGDVHYLSRSILNLSLQLLGILYLFFGAFAVIFENNHGFSLYQVGLSFLGIGVGMLTAMCTSPLWQWNYSRLVEKRKNEGGILPETEPEFQLPQ